MIREVVSNRENERMEKVKAAIATVLEAGCTVECQHIHLYKTTEKKKPVYTLLYFDKDTSALLSGDAEEVFEEQDDAITKFVKTAHMKAVTFS